MGIQWAIVNYSPEYQEHFLFEIFFSTPNNSQDTRGGHTLPHREGGREVIGCTLVLNLHRERVRQISAR